MKIACSNSFSKTFNNILCCAEIILIINFFLIPINAFGEGKLEIFFNPTSVTPIYNNSNNMWYWYFDLGIKNTGNEAIEVVAISGFNEVQCRDHGKQYCQHSDYGYFSNFREWFGSCYINGKLLIQPGQMCPTDWWRRESSASTTKTGKYYGWYRSVNGGNEILATSESLILLPSNTYKSGVFFTTNSDAARVSVNYDNSEESWSIEDEALDYEPDWVHNWERYQEYINFRETWGSFSHFLYSYEDFNVYSVDDGDIIVEYDGYSELGARKPLILVHGWQGEKGSNNYLGMNLPENLPTEYFQELLAFYDSGDLNKFSNTSEAAQFLYNNYKIYLYHYPSFKHITYNGRMLGEAIRRTPELWDYIQSGGEITIVGHSMGGLVARSFIEEHGLGMTSHTGILDDAGDPKGTFSPEPGYSGLDVLDKLITLATPHHGSPAVIRAWVDLNFLSGKNLDTPGALDLCWDDTDEAILTVFIELILGMGIDNNNVYYWKQRRSTDESNGLYKFDNYHGKAHVYREQYGSYYEEPNPWLRSLNENMFNKSPDSYQLKYYFYGGGVITPLIPNSFSNDYLENGIRRAGAHDDVTLTTNYILNDAVVPTRSAFLEIEGTLFEKDDYSSFFGENGRLNLFRFLQNQEFKNPPFYFMEGQDIYSQYRYFHDYDHDKMRGGSGNADSENFSGPFDYKDHWKNGANTGYSDYWAFLQAIGYPEEDFKVNATYADERLYWEPLFLKISMDLGFGALRRQSAHDKIGVFRMSQGMYYLDVNDSQGWDSGDAAFRFGTSGDLPVTGDWNGDGVDEVGVWRPSERRFYLDADGSQSWTPGVDIITAPFGTGTDLPVIGDWNNDGVDEIGVWRPSERRFYLDADGSRGWTPGVDIITAPFGTGTDLPVIGDWNNDGVDEIGVWRPSERRFYLDANGSRGWNSGDTSFYFGNSGDLPIAGDWNGDGVDEIGVWRPSNRYFYLDANGSRGWNSGDTSFYFGNSGDRPVAGNWP